MCDGTANTQKHYGTTVFVLKARCILLPLCVCVMKTECDGLLWDVLSDEQTSLL